MGPDPPLARRPAPDQFTALEPGAREDRLAATASEEIVERRLYVPPMRPVYRTFLPSCSVRPTFWYRKRLTPTKARNTS